MTSVLRSTRIMIPFFAAALFVAGCAKTPPPAEPVPPTPPAAAEQKATEQKTEQKDEGTQDAAKVVVAKVNGVELHMDALIRMMNRLAPRGGAEPESLEEHKKRSLDKLIMLELAYQQAKAKGLTIGPDKIDLAIKNLKENVGGEEEYAEYLGKTNATEADLRAQVERSLLVELAYAREVLAKVSVPEDEVRQEYEKQKHRFITSEKASVVDIFVLKSDGNASGKKVRELLKKVKADPDQNPWNLMLDGTFIVRDLYVDKNKEKELFEAAKKLKPQQLSGVIETPSGSHVIKLKTYSPERQLTFDEAKSKLEAKFKVPAQEKRTEEWEQEMRKDAKIEIVPVTVAQEEEKKP